MKKRTLKKSLAGFMVVAVLSGTIAPVSLIFAADEMRRDNDLVLEKLKSKQLEKVRQLKDFDGERKMKTFSVDESLKKTAEIKQPQKQNYVEGEILVKFKEQKINLEQSSGRMKATQFAAGKNLDKKEDIRQSNISVLKIKDSKTVEEKIAELKNDSRVEYVEPNYIRSWTSTIPSDTDFSNLWGLHNTTVDVDIDAPEAWDIFTGSNSVVVAVLDSGIAYNHPDLINNMWNGNANHGWDFFNNDNNPIDDNGHGTHVAGTIGAEGNNNIGVTGVNWNVKLMALKVGDYAGNVGDIAEAIDFAISNNVKIINASFGGPEDSQAEFDAIDRFRQAGGIFIAAAGNDTNNNDGGTHFYPSDYDLDNIISVSATNQNDDLASFSNYGVNSVDVGAPGVGIYSTVPSIDVMFNEDFEEIILPNIGNSFTQFGDNTWGTVYNSDNTNKFIHSDYQNKGNYANNIVSALDSQIINLTNKSNSYLQFNYYCDTEYGYDALGLFLYNGSDWDLVDTFTGLSYGSKIYPLADYAINNFQLEFFWMTDISNVGGPYFGCSVDDIKITKYSDGSDEQYVYMQGTSMAAPHVAGLAALIWGYKSELSYSEVKNVILETGDSLTSLENKTVTGKRINAFNALNFLTRPDVTINKLKTDDTTPELTGTVDDDSAIMTVIVNGEIYSATNNGDGTWILEDNTITELNIGIYDVEVRAERDFGEIGYDDSKDELVIVLDGQKPPFTVAIDNQKNARPVSGVSEAGAIYEFPVDGGITRFMAVYDPDSGISSSTEIGPVRSARPYFARTASEHKSIYAHAGGIPDALYNLNNHQYSVYNLDALTFDGEAYFWRDDNRIAPYNLYTSIERLNNFRSEFDLDSGLFTWPWIFSDTPSSIDNIGFDKDIVEVNYENSNYNVRWIYNETENVYYRQTHENGNYEDYIDKNGDQVSTVNLAIQYAYTDSFTEISQMAGEALVCRGGKCTNGVWAKDGTDSNVKFYVNGGEEFEFKTGKLWINVTSEVSDVTPPVRSNSSPSWELSSGTTETLISLNTDEDATCKYSTNPDIAYSDMLNMFEATGGETLHITTVAGLSDGRSYAYYVKCIDASNNANTDDFVISFSVAETPDIIPPVVVEVTPVQTPTNNNTPSYTFISDEAGSITYYGSCGPCSNINAIIGDNTVTFGPLADGLYDDCTIIVVDASGNPSDASAVSNFTVDTANPTAEETTAVTTPTSDTTPDIGITIEDGVIWEIKNGDDILEIGVGNGTEQTVALPELGEGTYNLTLIATDEAKNTTTVNLSEFTIDLSVSPISLSTLPNNPTNETTTDITVSGDDIVFYKYKLDDSDYSVEISIDINIVLSGLSEGEHTIFVKGRDGVENWSEEISETWTVDLTAPDTPVITDPAEAIILNADTYSITGTAEDNSLVKIYSGTELVGSQQLGIGETAYSIEVNLEQNADNNFTATATDLVGNESASATAPTITEDSIAPVVIITSPADGWITNQSIITIEYTADGTSHDNTEDLSEGTNTVVRNVTDDAGNVGSDSITVILDTTKPVITILGDNPLNLYVGDTYEEFGATAEDNVLEEIMINSEGVDTSEAGTYEVTYNVSDDAGNEADKASRTVIVSEVPEDTTPPDAIADLNIPSNNISNHTLKLKWTATGDDGSTGTASSYDIRYSDKEITNENWDDATQISSPSVSTPKVAGTAQSVEVNQLDQGTTYYFAMKVSDEVPNESGISNVVSAKTDTPSRGGNNSNGGSYSPPTNRTANNVPLKISSSQKGTLNQNLNNKNKVKVEIPKGSIKSTTTFTASEGSLEEGDIPKDKIGAFLFNGLVFNVEAVDLSNNTVREFSEDLTITLTVPDLPDDTTGLELYYYDDESGEWIIITDIEFGDDTITFKVNHLTQFAVFETNATKASSTSGAPEVKGVTTTEILDGDIIQCQSSDNPFAVYIVKIVGDTKYIRHIVSLEIFNYYGHLKWENLKQVESLNNYSLSGWVRYNTGENYTAAPTDKVYEINGDQTKHWINMTAEQFLSHGGSEPAIFNINQGELNLYITGVDVMSL